MAASQAHALARDELIHTLTVYQGVATADGAVGGDTIVDSNLIGMNDFITGKAVLIMSGPASHEDTGVLSFNNVTGTITLQSGFSAQITRGTIYRVINISSVETKIGTNVDAPGTTTLFAWLAKLFQHGGQGLVYYGVVTAVPGANQFTIPTLAGFGDTAFVGWSAFVFWDAAGGGAAPQGEQQTITAYTSATGNFTAGAFTAAVGVGDIILILHPKIAQIKNLTRPQASTQTVTAVPTVVGAAIEDTVPFKVSGYISLHNMLAGDTFMVVEEIRDQDDLTYRTYAVALYANVQPAPMVWFEPKVCQGWRILIFWTVGANRDITYQFFKEVASA